MHISSSIFLYRCNAILIFITWGDAPSYVVSTLQAELLLLLRKLGALPLVMMY